MPLQYIRDDNGITTALLVPIDEWNRITEKYADIEQIPDWQKKIIDQRLQAISQNPAYLRTIEELFDELDKEDK